MLTLDPDLVPDPDPNWAKILDPNPNSMYLEIGSTTLVPVVVLTQRAAVPPDNGVTSGGAELVRFGSALGSGWYSFATLK